MKRSTVCCRQVKSVSAPWSKSFQVQVNSDISTMYKTMTKTYRAPLVIPSFRGFTTAVIAVSIPGPTGASAPGWAMTVSIAMNITHLRCWRNSTRYRRRRAANRIESLSFGVRSCNGTEHGLCFVTVVTTKGTNSSQLDVYVVWSENIDRRLQISRISGMSELAESPPTVSVEFTTASGVARTQSSLDRTIGPAGTGS